MKERQSWREWVYSGDKVKQSAIQASQWRVSAVREQAWAGTLEGFHLKENVQYSLKQFSKTKDRKKSDLSPGKANTDQTSVTVEHEAALLLHHPIPIFGMLGRLETACEEQEERCDPDWHRWIRFLTNQWKT